MLSLPLSSRLASAWVAPALRRVALRGLGGVFAALVFVLPAPAEAQTTNANAKVELQKTAVSFIRDPERSDAQFPFWISRQDCVDDAKLIFRPKVTGITNAQRTPLQVWVGSNVDCTDVNQRTGTNARCSLVAEVRVPNNTTAEPIEVSSRDVARAAATSLGTDVQGRGRLIDCDAQLEENLTFYLMVVDGGGNVQGTVAKWEDTQIDLVGPPPPDEIEAGIGESKLILEWEVAESDERQDTDSWEFYCDFATNPEETMQGEGGAISVGVGGTTGVAGAAGAAGSGVGIGQGGAGSISDDPTCAPTTMVPGKVPEKAMRCGSAQGLATRNGRAKPLENFQRYAVGISAVDKVGNRGVLSRVACQTPEPVTTFFEAYRAAGGEGGGGFCNFGAAPASGLLSTALAASAAWLIRRRRKRA
jgi:hypothetical protein